MILTCPSCGTRYVVKDGAIPPDGRTVRCAQCKHSWHQDPEDLQGEGPETVPLEPSFDPDPEPVQHIPEEGYAEAEPEQAMSHPLGEPSGTATAGELGDHAHPDQSWPSDDDVYDEQPLPGPEIAPTASQLADDDPEPQQQEWAETMPAEAAIADDPYSEEVVPTEVPPQEDYAVERSSHPLRAARNEADDGYSPFAARDEEGPPRRRWPLTLLILVLAIAAIAAAFWFLAPASLKRSVGLADADSETPLLVQVQQHSRQQLASGNQLLEVSGLVINPTDETQSVPPLQAQLRSLEQKVVYKWTIPPPASQLAPGGSASFNSANLNIPPSAACLDVFFGRPDGPQPPCREEAASAGA